jgi:hypothetical protein
MKSIDTIKNKYIRRTMLIILQPVIFIIILVAAIIDTYADIKPSFKKAWRGQNDDR